MSRRATVIGIRIGLAVAAAAFGVCASPALAASLLDAARHGDHAAAVAELEHGADAKRSRRTGPPRCTGPSTTTTRTSSRG